MRGERRPGMKPSGRLGQSGQKHNAVRTKLLRRAITEKSIFRLILYFAGVNYFRLLTFGIKYLKGWSTLIADRISFLQIIEPEKGFVPAETGENLLACEIICEN